MSKKSISHNAPFRLYFGGLMQRIGVLPRIDLIGHSITLEATIEIPTRNPAAVEIQIILTASSDQRSWILRNFNIHSANPFLVLSGSDLLAHYGKRQADRNDDLTRPPSDELWIMSRAADLQALLVAYDDLANELGLPAIFGHD